MTKLKSDSDFDSDDRVREANEKIACETAAIQRPKATTDEKPWATTKSRSF